MSDKRLASRSVQPVLPYLSIDKTSLLASVYCALQDEVSSQEKDAVAIRPFLAGQAFEPELIQQMSAAFVRACEVLELKPADDPATRMVAKTVIELAERGLRDANILLQMTLREFGSDQA